ncbi:trans-1,2-dihydrobenzene-1,2-diol dehydrogenase [Aplysia californica]|uniref:Trans-1,2-dihydrobenzene-1,2-diol dehydrogenase n=1 Tax=Aplysia californica TaxID=6500 RepID=A0ABM0ZUC4_APLCA|nr:trans-1,2-dihydrobenzene-1,2-diol dehydrogenase [Aplysia californica]
MATRWAICGAGKIANDFCMCLNALPSSEHQIVAVGASSKEKAEKFAAQFGNPRSYGSYKELAELDDVDVVYVSVFHPLHVELCLMYINAGKSVLCEKPMALSLDGCRKVLQAAKDKGVLFVEGYWTRFFPVSQLIREQISSGAIGDVKLVQANFSIPIAEVPRLKQLDLGGGALMDIGLYPFQAANMVFKGKPQSIKSELTLNEQGVDKSGAVILNYGSGRMASLTFSAETQGGDNCLFIRGTKGTIQVPNPFWCSDQVILPSGEVKKFPLPHVDNPEKFNFFNCEGLTYEAQAVRECLLKGLKESPVVPHEDSETNMYILQQVLDQHGIKYLAP